MCKFLTENGVDIDEIANFVEDRLISGYESSMFEHKHIADRILLLTIRSPPLSGHINDECVENDGELQAIIECRSLLLQAGADPTIRCAEGSTTFFDAIASGTVVITALLELCWLWLMATEFSKKHIRSW